MVRVFAAYHYGGQTVHPVDDEAAVLASAVMDDDHLILAKANHCIEIVSLLAPAAPADAAADELDDVPTRSTDSDDPDDVNHNEAAQPQHQQRNTTLSFPTLDRVHRMLYCKQGNIRHVFLY